MIVLGLRLGFLHPLGVILVGVGEPLRGLRALVQLVAHRRPAAMPSGVRTGGTTYRQMIQTMTSEADELADEG